MIAPKAERPAKALFYSRHLLAAASVTFPSLPPPVQLLRRVAEAQGDPALMARIEKSAARCERSECFRRAMGW